MTEKVMEFQFKTKIEFIDELKFNVIFDLDGAKNLLMDEPPEFGGKGEGPNASRMIGAGVANCLSASLLFCLKKSKAEILEMNTDIVGTIKRNENGKLRLKSIDVKIYPKFKNKEDLIKLERCKNIYEDYCIVTESLRNGIDIQTEIIPKLENE